MIGVDWIPIGACDIQAYTENEKAALAILNDGKSYFHIAYKLHVSFERAREIVFSIRKKESLIMGKLTDQQRAEIYQKWKDGQTPKELAKEYSVSDQSIYKLVNKLNAQKPAPAELEDVENGIPNTPLLPQKKERKAAQINPEFEESIEQMVEDVKKKSAIEVKNAENAEKISENAAPEKLPDFVMDAVDNELNCVELDIESHEERIADLQEELRTLEAKRQKLADWLEAHT